MYTDRSFLHTNQAPRAAAWMLACVSTLAMVGILAGVSTAAPGEAWSTLSLRCIHVAMGLIAFLVGVSITPEQARRLAPGALVLVFLVLMGMFVIDTLGHVSHAAKRWLDLGPIRLQPSAFLQFLWPIALATWCAKHESDMDKPRKLVRLMLLLGLLVVPVLFQPDLGSVLILVGVTGIVLLFAGAPIGILRVVIPIAIAAVVGGALLFDHIGERLSWWKEPGYQVRAASHAFSAGGVLGRGPGEGLLKYGHVPEGESDFILALIGEEWGFLGTFGIWILFVAFTLLGVRVARHARSRYGAVLMATATLMISVQAALNMAVVTGVAPPKGLPLPFVSRGGSSILALSALLGVAVQAACERRRPAPTLDSTDSNSQEDYSWTESSALASSR